VLERNTRRYDYARDRFASETRDEAWAPAQEQLLRTMIEEQQLDDLVETTECKSSMCQLRVRFSGLTVAGAAVRIGPLTRALGDNRVLRNEGPPENRSMIIYMPRDGRWPDEPAEGAAP
jgi:hypothetical protein